MKEKKLYQCPECGLFYEEKKWQEKCQVWCKKYKSCNLEIIKYAVKPGSENSTGFSSRKSIL